MKARTDLANPRVTRPDRFGESTSHARSPTGHTVWFEPGYLNWRPKERPARLVLATLEGLGSAKVWLSAPSGRKAMKPFRIRLTDRSGNMSYLVRRHDKIQIDYFSANETPLSLSNLVGNEAAELRFALEDAIDDSSASRALSDRLERQWKNHPAMMPQVEVI
jgi:hypothetical protein